MFQFNLLLTHLNPHLSSHLLQTSNWSWPPTRSTHGSGAGKRPLPPQPTPPPPASPPLLQQRGGHSSGGRGTRSGLGGRSSASRVNSASDGLDTAANSTEVDDGPEADFSSGNKDACVLEVRINLRGHIFFGIPLRQLLVMVSWRNIRLLKNQLIR